jgi:TolB-like protein/DNA-binding winged helix-turn-helix (wHTH) protein/Flp pilus assembly protein TadD
VNKPGQESFFLDDWRVSPAEGLLVRGNELVRLEPKAMQVLVYLASRSGDVVTREELEQNVWRGELVGYGAVTNTVIKLRKALQDDPRQPRFIATIPKKGYQLIASTVFPENGDNPRPDAHAAGAAITGVLRDRSSWTSGRTTMVMVALACILVFGLLWSWPEDNTGSNAPPSIAVLPFDSLSDDPKQDYLADGITEDIITDLSKLSNIMVIASTTSSTYKGKLVSAEEVGADLEVGFVLKGSVRQLGDDVRVNVQLVDTGTGFNAWAQRYDRKMTEMFAVQDEVTRSIVKALAVKITNQEEYRLAQKTTDSLGAYDLFQEGQRIYKGSTKETNEQAREAYRKAIALDPGYGRAYGAMAITLASDYRREWTDTPNETLDRALGLAEKAVALDDSSPQTHWALGFVYLARKDYANAEKAAAQSISVAPNYADGYGLLALVSSHIGQPERAIELIAKGMSLNPYYTWEYLYVLGVAHYMLGDYDEAITTLEKAQVRNENVAQVKLFLAASYVKGNRPDDAEWVVAQLQMQNPTATLSGVDKTMPIANPRFKDEFLEDLRKAGLPE